MPRQIRRGSESGIFHIVARGIDRQTIFHDDEDRRKYLLCLADCQSAEPFTLYAYCLMDNHVHLLLRPDSGGPGAVFRRLGARYVAWYNAKYDRAGHLFQDRFRSEPVEDDAYFLDAMRYIAQNPVRARLCAAPEEYLWSSFCPRSPYPGKIDRELLAQLSGEEDPQAFLAQAPERALLDADTSGRRGDAQVAERICALCGLDRPLDLARLSPEEQRACLCRLRKERCSIRQLARLTGLTRGQVDWITKQGREERG